MAGWVALRRANSDGEHTSIPFPHLEILATVSPGQALLIDGGRVRVEVTGLRNDRIDRVVLNGGAISNRRSVNLPGTILKLSLLTAKDRTDLAFGLHLDVDRVAIERLKDDR